MKNNVFIATDTLKMVKKKSYKKQRIYGSLYNEKKKKIQIQAFFKLG